MALGLAAHFIWSEEHENHHGNALTKEVRHVLLVECIAPPAVRGGDWRGETLGL